MGNQGKQRSGPLPDLKVLRVPVRAQLLGDDARHDRRQHLVQLRHDTTHANSRQWGHCPAVSLGAHTLLGASQHGCSSQRTYNSS